MKTYWFTIADGEKYRIHADRLRRSLDAFGIEIQVLASDNVRGAGSKRHKILGIQGAPRDCERIVYLDADTLVLDPQGIDNVNGAWRIPWRIPIASCVPKSEDPQHDVALLRSFYQQHELSEFAEGGDLDGIEWNSGVIVGNRDVLSEVAWEWALWWDRIQSLFGGRFRRDQVSFRIAYHKVAMNAADWKGLPPTYNWVASYFGINPNVNVLHRTMVKDVPWLEEGWEQIVRQRLAGEIVATSNRMFDVSGIVAAKPSLVRQTSFDRGAQLSLLRQTLEFCRPRNVLLCGSPGPECGVAPLLGEFTTGLAQVDACDELQPERLHEFDLILFCGVDYSLRKEHLQALRRDTVCCFMGIQDMRQYSFLFEIPYVRICDHGFGVYSHASKIATWRYVI